MRAMQLEVDLESAVAEVVLTGVDEYTRLAVTVVGDPDADRVNAALADWGVVEDEYVWLEIGRLERALNSHPDRLPDWLPRFVAMIDYAASKGWVDEDNRRVRAHRER
ncbi:hypothetical protein [Rhodococcus sp. NPDC127528]|uniref:hypothetical protein n=1 Tax=unclassified Rhodococcus (in: high G+C Gram-positive bacteria) TaxID=192944 RepID=UPI00362538D3